jgi:hypothetical protein
MSTPSTLANKLEKFKEQYYQENKKKTFFTKSQKKDCAEKITQHFSVDQLLQNSIYVKESVLFFDYPIIKRFLHPTIYQSVIDHIDNHIFNLLTNHEMIDITIDMKSFTVTAAQRYSDLIQLFCSRYLQDEQYVKRIHKIYIHNSPSIIEVLRSMFSHFMSNTAQDKVVFLKN